jgi:hypothetical protein
MYIDVHDYYIFVMHVNKQEDWQLKVLQSW